MAVGINDNTGAMGTGTGMCKQLQDEYGTYQASPSTSTGQNRHIEVDIAIALKALALAFWL